MNNNKIMAPTIGADPELFLYSESKQKFVPVCGLVGGTKDEPIKITDDGFSLQEDNVMLEYTIKPSKTVEEFIGNINFAKDYITETVLRPLNLVPRYVASAFFDYDDLDNEAAQLFGCSPDFNAWTLEQNNVQSNNPLMRTAGGHIHVGFKDPDMDVGIEIIKAMDLFLGVPSIILDKDTQRREVYGKAGAYRFKPYGVEYRVLSTFWTEKDELTKWAFNATMRAIDFVNSGGIITNPEHIIQTINTCNKNMALEIIDDYNMELVGLEELINN